MAPHTSARHILQSIGFGLIRNSLNGIFGKEMDAFKETFSFSFFQRQLAGKRKG